MNRTNQILSILLIAQIIIGVVVFWPRQAASQGEAGPLLADFDPAQIDRVEITDNEGNTILMAQQGEEWVMPNADDFPVQGEKVTTLLESVEKVQSDRLVTRTEASHDRLQVAADNFNRLLEMSNGESYKLYIGSAGGAGATHVRPADRSEVFLTPELTAWDVNARASAWIDTLYFSLPVTAPVSLTLENANGVLHFEKENDAWTMQELPAGETFNETAFSSMLNQAVSVRMARPIGQSEQDWFNLDNPRATVTLQTPTDTYTLRVGGKEVDTAQFVFSSSDSDYYVWVDEFTGNTFAQKTLDDFIQQPPTPTPASQ